MLLLDSSLVDPFLYHIVSDCSDSQKCSNLSLISDQRADKREPARSVQFVAKLCELCEEEPVNVKFLPCGHTALCRLCAVRAVRCLVCKV